VRSELPPVLERYELKYLIPYSYVELITRFIEPYCSLDYYSSKSADNFYVVNSLYFDTFGHEFLKQRLWGKERRFNMRVRTYADGKRPPYYMEIKHKTGSTVRKYRATAREEEWPDILGDPGFRVCPDENPAERRNKELFLRLASSYAIEPKILTQYRRRAFFSTVDEYARLTMDIDMRYRLENRLTTVPDERLINYDNENIFIANSFSDQAAVVLELKCNAGQVPMWMLDLIKHFQLKQVGFSKYMSSMLTALGDNGFHYMSGDRMRTCSADQAAADIESEVEYL
jgi:hypothetical protein